MNSAKSYIAVLTLWALPHLAACTQITTTHHGKDSQFPTRSEYRVQVLTKATGEIPSDDINCIDFSHNTMWIGTDQGLFAARKDGYDLLLKQNILCIGHEKNGLIGTSDGLWSLGRDGPERLFPKILIGPVLDVAESADEIWAGQLTSLVRIKDGNAKIMLRLPFHGPLPKATLHGLLFDGSTFLVGANTWPTPYPNKSDTDTWAYSANTGNPPLFRFEQERWTTIAYPTSDDAFMVPRYRDTRSGDVFFDSSEGPLVLANGAFRPAIAVPQFLNQHENDIFTRVERGGQSGASSQDEEFAQRWKRLAAVIPKEFEKKMTRQGAVVDGKIVFPVGITLYSALSEADRNFYDDNIAPFFRDDSVHTWLRHPTGNLAILTHSNFYEYRDTQWKVANLVDKFGKTVDPFGWNSFDVDADITFLSFDGHAYWVGIRGHGMVKMTPTK